jgi:hypothetical protein
VLDDAAFPQSPLARRESLASLASAQWGRSGSAGSDYPYGGGAEEDIFGFDDERLARASGE